jgi:hypothetical protein
MNIVNASWARMSVAVPLKFMRQRQTDMDVARARLGLKRFQRADNALRAARHGGTMCPPEPSDPNIAIRTQSSTKIQEFSDRSLH